jgi:2-C-methyl-D-erythritol 4-phosphate cytidylyltransferase / 2-C-methyl-D-erythritol 2,4-cyclodiphosphate synthase
MNHAIIVSAGNSTRMQGVNKTLAKISGKSVLAHTLLVFEKCDDVDSITVVTQKQFFKEVSAMQEKYSIKKLKNIIEGGKERQDSVFSGVESIKNAKDNDVIAIHNGSNPMVKSQEISHCIAEAKKHGAAVCAFPLKDTIKRVSNGFVKETIPREGIWQMQTPQCVQYGIFRKAKDASRKQKKYYTDDAALVEAIGKKVKIVQCSNKNVKITTPDDLEIAQKMLGTGMTKMGIGQDHHRFALKGKKPLVIGGYVIPNEVGLEANSDGDIVLHALFNAISSALGGRSLSITADSMCKNGITDSSKYLEPLLKEMRMKGFSVGNVSVSIEAKKPKLEPHHDKIKASVCSILGVSLDTVGLTFTSGEGLTGMGRGEGMACMCIATLKKS